MAMVSGVPVLAVAYTLKKHRGLLRTVGMEHWVCDIESLDGQELVDAFDRSWAQRAETRRHLAEAVPAARESSLEAAKLIADDWERVAQWL
jgi:polysaccharide pyruvyl transferase WcaK-like protein